MPARFEPDDEAKNVSSVIHQPFLPRLTVPRFRAGTLIVRTHLLYVDCVFLNAQLVTSLDLFRLERALVL